MPRGVPKSGKRITKNSPLYTKSKGPAAEQPANPASTEASKPRSEEPGSSNNFVPPHSALNHLASRIVKTEVSTQLKSLLVTPLAGGPKAGRVYYKAYLQTFLEEALKNPNSRASLLLAQSILKDGLLEDLDSNTQPPVDIPFLEYQLSNLCFDKQLEVLHATKMYRKICMMTSRRAGKSRTDARIMVAFALVSDSPILYVGLTQSDGMDQTFDEVLSISSKIGLTPNPDRNKGHITLSNGSKIRWVGNKTLPEQEKLRGGKYRLIVIDECQSQRMMHNLIDNILRPTLADYKDSVIVLSGTPPRVKKTYFENCWNSGAYKCFHWVASDNPFMPNWEQTIEDVCKEKGLTKDSPLIQREYYGNLVYDNEALIFAGFKTYETTHIGEYLPENPLDPVKLSLGTKYELPAGFVPTHLYGGIDFGYSDKAATCLIACDEKTATAYLCYEMKQSRLDASQTIQAVKDCNAYALELQKKYPTIRVLEFYADSGEEALAADLYHNHKINCRLAYKIDKVVHFGLLAEQSRTGCFLVPKDSIAQDEMERQVYARDDNDNILMEVDEDAFHADLMDAVLYAARRWLYDLGLDQAKFNYEKTEMDRSK